MPTLRDAIASWWIRNANIRHGHLPDTALQEFDPEPAATPSAGKSWLPAIASGIAGLALGPAGYAVYQWLTADSQAPPLSEAPPAVVAPLEPSSGSLYQYLEDHDLHLPPSALP